MRAEAVMRTSMLLLVGLVFAGCGERRPDVEGGLTGSVVADGSSTVFPITEAVAEEFMIEHGGGVRVTVGQSGTGGGFKRFCSGETTISNASRPIRDSEIELCRQNGVEFVEFPIAIDGLAVVVPLGNTWAQCLTVAELRRIWEPGSTIRTWADVREGWPVQRLTLYGPGTDSGTFDYFTEVINGEAGASRPDYTASEDDNVLVQGVAGDPNALAYFGFAYFDQNRAQVNAVAVDGGSGCVAPTSETVRDNSYAPLSRPLSIYVNRADMARPEVRAFLRFYMEQGAELVREVGYVPLQLEMYEQNLRDVGEDASGAN